MGTYVLLVNTEACFKLKYIKTYWKYFRKTI